MDYEKLSKESLEEIRKEVDRALKTKEKIYEFKSGVGINTWYPSETFISEAKSNGSLQLLKSGEPGYYYFVGKNNEGEFYLFRKRV